LAIEMKKFAMSILFLLVACPVWATTYYLAPASGGGNDSNKGTSVSTPWLTPNHPLNCGDVISAAPSTDYSPSNFGSGQWGAVTCLGGNSVAWLKCASFDSCKINSSRGLPVMDVSASYWGVQGWEVTSTGTYGTCFAAQPPVNNGANIQHIIFANDIANGCTGGGISTYSNGSAGVDYIAVIGNIAYNAAQGSAFCYSGISIYQPAESDSLEGTHIFVAGNFSWGNFDGPCNGGSPTDGEGIIADSWGALSYKAQGVIENNIVFLNGSRGIEVLKNGSAPIYILHNTTYGNNNQPTLNGHYCGDIYLSDTTSVQVSQNINQTNATTACNGPSPLFAFWVSSSGPSTTVANNFVYSAAGNDQGNSSNLGFVYGSNLTGIDPNFVNPTNPGAPSCGAATSVPNCMATVINNFTPRTTAATAYGRQPISTGPRTDPLFPQWLCNVNLPAGLVTMACQISDQPPPTLKVAGVT
jgi:hypothetical protein